MDVLGHELELSPEELAAAVSPENFVAVRTIYGGPAPSETQRALRVELDTAEIDSEWLLRTRAHLDNAQMVLQRTIDERIA